MNPQINKWCSSVEDTPVTFIEQTQYNGTYYGWEILYKRERYGNWNKEVTRDTMEEVFKLEIKNLLNKLHDK